MKENNEIKVKKNSNKKNSSIVLRKLRLRQKNGFLLKKNVAMVGVPKIDILDVGMSGNKMLAFVCWNLICFLC